MTQFTNVFGNATVSPAETKFSSFTLTANTVFFWPYNTSDTQYVVAGIMEFTLANPYSITLPDATEVTPGESTLVRNIGSATLTVLSTGGATLGTVAAGQAKLFYLTSNATADGTWSVIQFGTGTSTADAATLAGYGLTAIGATLNVNTPVTSSAVAYIVTGADRGKTLVFTGGFVNCTLPTVASVGNGFTLQIKNNGTGTITFVPQGTDTIDQTTLAAGESLILICSGSAWYSVGYGRAATFAFTKLNKNLNGFTGGSVTSLSMTDIANKIINFYGSPSGDVTVLLPAVASVYYMSSDVVRYNVIVKTSTGVSVTLGPGASTVVVCDGVDCVVAVSSVYTDTISLNAGTFTDLAISFQASPNTGIYLPSVGNIAMVAGGIERFHIFGGSGQYGVTIRDAVDIGYDSLTGLASGTGGLRVAGGAVTFSYNGLYNDANFLLGTVENSLIFEYTKNAKIGTNSYWYYTVGGAASFVHALSSSTPMLMTENGQVQFSRGIADQAFTIDSAPISGATLTATQVQSFMCVVPLAPLAALSIVFPARPNNGHEFGIAFRDTITALTLVPGTSAFGSDIITDTLTTATSTTRARWKYYSANMTWYRMY